ncbi:hypothetical protein EDC39_10222 [Geothermobacter ehrlichii]|uniref:Uncharacterized protein n=1 Tax=Geothermobacter ehrlichii TaxID=213224 RepID=A0A5D3WPV2_9BACT|nr:hypothetical protein [Geothermobacter ehrlichii]TYO99500.1 hypothetical protein EDC39_10222 [Geothermobacter ehrlichii]
MPPAWFSRIRLAAGLRRLFLFSLVVLSFSPSPAQAKDLVFGYTPEVCDLIRTTDQADALAAYLSEQLGRRVVPRAFRSERNLHYWLDRFREVDLAVVSAGYLSRNGRGGLIPVAGYVRKSDGRDGQGMVVARRGFSPALFVRTGNALAGLSSGELLGVLDVLTFYRPGEKPDMVVRGTDEHGRTSRPANDNGTDLPAEVDVGLPRVVIDSPADRAVLNRTPRLVYDADGGDVDILLDGKKVGDVDEALKKLGDGLHRIVVRVRDERGQSAEDMVSFTLDRTPPQLVLLSPPEVSLESEPVIDWRCEGNGINVFLDGEAVQVAAKERLPSLSDGTHHLRLECVDAAGNIAWLEREFVIDTLPPVFTVAPLPATVGGGRLTVHGTREPGSFIDLVTVPGARVSEARYPAGDRWEIDVDGLENGHYFLVVSARDAHGNSGRLRFELQVERKAPRVRILAPAVGLTYDNTPLLQFQVERGKVRVLVDGEVVDKYSGMALDPLAPGEHVVRVEAVDDFGNRGYAECHLVIVESEPPPVRTDTGPWFELFSARLDRPLLENGSDRPLVLSIGPLSFPGETVYIEQWADSNGNGVADAGEQVIRTFRLVDGLASPSSLVPGDSDGVADGRIRAELSPRVLHDRMDGAKHYVLLIMAEHDLAEVAFRVATD